MIPQYFCMTLAKSSLLIVLPPSFVQERCSPQVIRPDGIESSRGNGPPPARANSAMSGRCALVHLLLTGQRVQVFSRTRRQRIPTVPFDLPVQSLDPLVVGVEVL